MSFAKVLNTLCMFTVSGLNGLSLSGLTHTNTIYLVEQLYGAGYCHTYKFRYHSHELRRHDEVLHSPSLAVFCLFSNPNLIFIFLVLPQKHKLCVLIRSNTEAFLMRTTIYIFSWIFQEKY